MVHGVLDSGEAAVADQQDRIGRVAGEQLDMRQRVGAFGAAGRHGPAAGQVGRDHRGRDGLGVGGGVDAVAAVQRVGAALPLQDVVAVIAGDDVGEVVAGAMGVAMAQQRQVLDVGGQREVGGGAHLVGALAGRLDDGVAVVGEVGVVG